MTWVDAAALMIIMLSAAFSMVRGFVREVLGVGAWVGAAWAAVRFYTLILSQVESILPDSMKHFGLYVAMAIVFIVVLVVLSLVSALVGGLVRDSPLSTLDRS
ncbi:MAG: CvpA family protein, partial [Acidocella sp.]|nr:CvpA family protein [Acidocella sp.]